MQSRSLSISWLGGLASIVAALTVGQTFAADPPVDDAKYRPYFARYVDSRSMPERALNATVGWTMADVGRSFALLAGVSRYPKMKGTATNLAPARADIEKLATYLVNQEFFDEVVVLLDDAVTDENLGYFLEKYFPRRLEGAPYSRFLFAYSGHGTTRKDGRGYLLKSNATSLDDTYNGINLGKVKAMLDEVVYNGHFVLALVNACYGADLHGRRGFGDKPYLPKLEGAHVITAGGTGEVTWHDPRLGPGSIFFETLLLGLDGRADSNQEGIVSVKEIDAYLTDTIKHFTDEHQNPLSSDLRPEGSRGGFFFFDQQSLINRKVVRAFDPAKLGAFGDISAWERTFGSAAATRIVATADGGYAVGVHSSEEQPVARLLKLDASGELQWERALAPGSVAAIVAAGGGYALLAADRVEGAREGDFQVLKLDAEGRLQWKRSFENKGNEGAGEILATTDGGYAVAGFTELKGAGESDVWVLKFDAKGSLQWERTFGDEGHDYLGGFTATADGGYAVANIRESNDGSAAWLLKLDASGELQWERKLKVDWADAMITTADGGYALAGTTLDGSWVTLTLMLKLDASGELQWERKFGGGSESSHSSLAATADGGYVVAHTQTDLEAFDSESAILKLDVAGGLQWKRTFKGNGINTIIASADGGYAVAGWTHLEGTRGIQGWVLKLDQNGQISDSLAKQ